MNVLFLSTVYPRAYEPNKGVYCLHLCRELATDGHIVRVISPRSWIEAARKSVPTPAPTGVGLTTYPWYFHPPGVLHSWSAEFMWASIYRRVRLAVEEFQPDCVLSYWAHPDGEVAVRAAALAGVPAGVIVGGSDVLLLPRDPSRKRAVTYSLSRADAVFTVSRDLRDRAVQLGVDAAKVHVVYQGVDAKFTPGSRSEARARLGLSREGRLLVWVGRMDPVKGLEVLIDACGRLRDAGIEFSLALVGDGPARDSVVADVQRLGLVNRVQFSGMVAHDQLPDWYRAADLTVLSSHSEGIPNVLRESLACGTPYVSTRVGGIVELSDDPAIRLVPSYDPAALAEAIGEALKNPQSLGQTRIDTWADYARTLAAILVPPADGKTAIARSTAEVQA